MSESQEIKISNPKSPRTENMEEPRQLVFAFVEKAPAKSLAEIVLGILRNHGSRPRTRQETGWNDEEIERQLTSPGFLAEVSRAVGAYIVENLPAAVQATVNEAEEAQPAAWKSLLELTGLVELVRAALLPTPAESSEVFISTEFERRLLEKLRALPPGKEVEDVFHMEGDRSAGD